MDVENYIVDLPVLYYGINYGRTISISFKSVEILTYKISNVMELPKSITIRFPSLDIELKGSVSESKDKVIIFTFSEEKKNLGQIRVLKYMLRRFIGLDLK